MNKQNKEFKVIGNIISFFVFVLVMSSFGNAGAGIAGVITIIGFIFLMSYLRSKAGKAFIQSLQNLDKRFDLDTFKEQQKLPNQEIEQNSYQPADPTYQELEGSNTIRNAITIVAGIFFLVCIGMGIVLLAIEFSGK